MDRQLRALGRNLVLATMRDRRVGLLPADGVVFVGSLVPCGGNTFRRTGPRGEERRLAACLPAAQVRSILDASPFDLPDDAVHADLKCDEDLGVTVVNFTAPHRAFQRQLDEIARWAAAACLVEELVASPGGAWR